LSCPRADASAPPNANKIKKRFWVFVLLIGRFNIAAY
jgi:hypothetical protein